eukprot:1652759-Pleurochrysis_carterae.AAC.3
MLCMVFCAPLPMKCTGSYQGTEQTRKVLDVDLLALEACTCAVFCARCVSGEPGNEIVDEVRPIAGETSIHKPGKGSFYATGFEQMLADKGVTHLLVTGARARLRVRARVGVDVSECVRVRARRRACACLRVRARARACARVRALGMRPCARE